MSKAEAVLGDLGLHVLADAILSVARAPGLQLKVLQLASAAMAVVIGPAFANPLPPFRDTSALSPSASGVGCVRVGVRDGGLPSHSERGYVIRVGRGAFAMCAAPRLGGSTPRGARASLRCGASWMRSATRVWTCRAIGGCAVGALSPVRRRRGRLDVRLVGQECVPGAVEVHGDRCAVADWPASSCTRKREEFARTCLRVPRRHTQGGRRGGCHKASWPP